MTILNRKPKHTSTSDLIWSPSPAPSDGIVGDSNPMLLDPSHLAFAQDVIIARDGTLRSRGGLVATGSTPTTHPLSLMQSTASVAYTALHVGSPKGTFWGTAATDLTGFVQLAVMGEDANLTSQNISADTNLYRWGSTRFPDLPGGIFCGGSFSASLAATISSFMWGGNAVTTGNNSTGTITSPGNSLVVTGTGTAWTSALNGTFLFYGSGGATTNGLLIGQVDTVTSTTTLNLKTVTNAFSGITPIFKATRMLQHAVYKGRITCSTTSTAVIGSGTKFLSCFPAKAGVPASYLTTPLFGGGQSTWGVYRLSDGLLIGQVANPSGVVNDTYLNLAANSLVAMTNEEYFIQPSVAAGVVTNTPINYFGAICSEYYADRYWYGGLYTNSKAAPTVSGNPASWCDVKLPSSIAFSRKGQPEHLDLSANTGDILTLPNVQGFGGEVRALKAMRGGMLILRGADTYFLTGYSPETFRTIKILDDGCAGANFVKKYNEGVIWPGTKSIYFFDGVKVVDLLQNKIKKFYQDNLSFTLVGTKGGSGLSNDHYIYSAFTTTSVLWPKANTTDSLNGISLVINMTNGAISFFTNTFFWDSTLLNLSSGTIEEVLLGSNGFPESTSGAAGFYQGSKLFTESAVAASNIDGAGLFNTFLSGSQVGPSVMFETIKYSMRDATRMKFFKMFLMNYTSAVSMSVVVSGTNQSLGFPNTATGTVVGTAFPVNVTNGILKRIKFLIRAPQVFIRVYQTAVPVSGSQKFKLYWYTIGGKFMRIGRSQ